MPPATPAAAADRSRRRRPAGPHRRRRAPPRSRPAGPPLAAARAGVGCRPPPGAAVPRGAPAWARTGSQPAWMGAGAAAPTAWQEAAPPPPPEPPPPVDQVCPTCGVENDPSLRFCRKCGHAFAGPVLTDSGPAFVATPETNSLVAQVASAGAGHQPGRPGRVPAEHAAALPREALHLGRARHRRPSSARWRFIGQNPIGWVTARWQDLRGEVAQVQGVDGGDRAVRRGRRRSSRRATSSTTCRTRHGRPRSPSTTWPRPANAACVAPSATSPPGVPASAVLIPTSPVTLRSISVAAGLPEGDQRRLRQWRPKTLQLGFSDGSCQRLGLGDTSALQELELEPVETAQIRVSVVDAYPPGARPAVRPGRDQRDPAVQPPLTRFAPPRGEPLARRMTAWSSV